MRPDQSPVTLQVSGLSKVFAARDRRATPTRALDDVSFTIRAGECLGVVGESGSGKSTLARIVVGLETADAGTVDFPRIDLSAGARREQRLARAGAAQMVFQNPLESLDRRLTVAQALEGALRVRAGSSDLVRARVPELLAQVHLEEHLASRRPHQLSGGQRQRVAIARALAARPAALILDEAVSALDVSVQSRIIGLVDEIRERTGVAVLFVSHDLSVVGAATQRVLVLFRGRVVETGMTHDVLSRPSHPYTRLLLASSPGEGWDPQQVATLRAEFLTALAHDQAPER